jgi:3-oxoacyl-[acyl-carrier protein] reductase
MNIIITGTSRGLGKSTAEYLAKQGHSIIGCARSESDSKLFTHISGVNFKDPSTFGLLDSFFKNADCLVNNAAIAFDGLLATQGEESITELVQVNLISTLILTKRYIRERLKARKPGTIVNVSSIIAVRGYAGLATYAATKSGLDGMTRSLARELGPKGFRINSVLPGYMETDMSKSLDARQKEQITRRTPLGRLATVDDVNSVIEFLLSDASKFVTGQSIVVDGGITV